MPERGTARGPGDGDRGAGEAREPAFVAWVAVALDRWRFIAIVALTAVIAALVVGLLMPQSYVARTLLAPAPTQAAPRAQFLNAQMPLMLAAGLSGTDPNTKIIGTLLESRSLTDSIHNRFGNVRITATQKATDGSISVVIHARTPESAALAANAYPEFLNGILTRMAAEARRHKQAMLREQVGMARQELERSQDSLVAFERAQHAPDLEQQAKRTVDAAAELQQQIAEKEVALRVLRRTATPANPQLISAEAELASLRTQLEKFTRGGNGPVLLGLESSPELKARSVRLLGEYTKDQQVYLSLLAALTQAQIDDADQLPVVTVVDSAVLPVAPSGASLPIVGALAAVLGVLAGAVLAIAGDALDGAREDGRYARVFAAWRRFRGDLRMLGRSRRRSAASAHPVPESPRQPT
jgi:uncharacterized protein involved in exopolysaccharide biosynthesis